MPEVNYTANPRPSDQNYVLSREYDVCPGSGGGEPPAPSCTVVQEDVTGATAGITANTENARYFGQRFVASATYTACKVTLRLSKSVGATGLLNVGIWSHNATGNGTPNALLQNKTIDISTLGTTEGDATAIDFSVSITSGTTYWIVIDDPTNGGLFSGGATWYSKTAGVGQANLCVLSSDGASWSEFDNLRQLKFQLYKVT